MARISASSVPSQIDRINRFKGINVSVDPTQLEYNESPSMLNMTLDTEGALDKRTGYAKLFPTALGGTVWSAFDYRKSDGTTEHLLHAGTNLYRMPVDGTQPTSIYASLANSRSNMFAMAGKVYIQDGTNYLEYDGTTVKEPDPYIPTLFISTPPAGGGTAFEDFNLLGTKFKQSFSGDGTATVFQLALSGLDATPVTAVVGVTTINEGSGLTVDRTLGKVTFTTAPATGTPNNVVITASKTTAGMKQKITACKNARLYGGTNDTRVFMWSKNILYRSDVYRPNYFPENAFQKVGGDDDIQNMVIQYDTAVIEKEFSKWSLRYEQDSTGKALFPIRPINDTVGCIAPLSSQIVENAPVSLTRNGVYTLAGGNVRDERNVSQISKRIDKLLLAEPNLKDAISIDFDQKYMIFLNGNVYVWDYRLNEWYPWDNFPATSVWEIDSRLYFGDVAGNVYYLKKLGENAAYRDNTQAIIWHWYGKQNAFGMDERRKLVEKVEVTIKPDSATSAEMYYITDQTQSPLVARLKMNMFDFNNFNFGEFTFLVNNFPQSTMTKIKAKKIVYFQLYFKGQEIDESLGLLSISIIYSPQSLVK
ncbi:hypothetical protein SD71_10785 [Cohnella kolymensis]|uniref:Uncharacterized protein n=1 Tax=Cohnella kolymensis TaxID=1590652 RepID=A0ABR5A5D6_9BACL|nr:hypothetical protein [Cohnella kolymensis]KIL35868.1 hypothetical protein SD71_10785 [Cohnella kolymensis]